MSNLYTFSKTHYIELEEILQYVTEEEIFNIVLEEKIKIGDFYKSPFREDKNPGCYFEIYRDTLIFVDFGSDKKYYNCVSFVQNFFSLSNYRESLIFIYNTLILNKNTSVKKKKKKKIYFFDKEKKDRNVQIIKRDFHEEDLKYWGSYGITKNNLIEDGVIPISSYRAMSNKGKYFCKTFLKPAYAYTDFKENKKKIYCPKGVKNEKWFTNCSPNDLGNIRTLEKKDYVVITKSYKDFRVLKNQSYNSFWIQSESIFPNVKTLDNIFKEFKFKRVYILFDNDSVGKAKSKVFKKYLDTNFNNIENIILDLPKYKNIKDPSDLYCVIGEKPLQDFLSISIIKK